MPSWEAVLIMMPSVTGGLTGGSGANFIVRWEADSPVSPPVTEGIMISTASQLGISFTSPGQVIPD